MLASFDYIRFFRSSTIVSDSSAKSPSESIIGWSCHMLTSVSSFVVVGADEPRRQYRANVFNIMIALVSFLKPHFLEIGSGDIMYMPVLAEFNNCYVYSYMPYLL